MSPEDKLFALYFTIGIAAYVWLLVIAGHRIFREQDRKADMEVL